MNFEARSELLKEMIESLQCVRCNAVPGFGAESRERFHCSSDQNVLCKSCKDKCGSGGCRSCRRGRPLPAIEKILENLPRFCPNYKSGCREIFAESENLEEHKTSCPFRLVPCVIYEKCGSITFANYHLHLTKRHEVQKLRPEPTRNKFEVVMNFSNAENDSDYDEFDDTLDITIENGISKVFELKGK